MLKIVKNFEIKNRLGIHARAAAQLVKISSRFESQIFIEKDGQEVNAKSLLGILTLACPRGSWISIRAQGTDAQKAVDALGKLIDEKFGEDE